MEQPANRFQTSDPMSDLTLVVQDKKLFVHKTFLMVHSTVFYKVFMAQKDLRILPLTGKKYSLVVDLLQQIYPGDAVSLFKDDTLLDLLELAREYDVQQVFNNCSQYITKRLDSKTASLSTHHVLFYLGIVDGYERLQSLRQMLVDMASRVSATELRRSDMYSAVPATAMRDVLQRRIELFETDPDVAECLKRKNLK
ncbi:uncharacterized protein LOC112574119 [Pomacea canaliculata]|uniref:uncharacterized protein LOC112574119 n=1 Tax=Pomacea canaliculata TaxID=400727 RepID=UPI000D73A8E2|nr:uncharacterized protein LOC112574119 [Pomacea canaliculata]